MKQQSPTQLFMVEPACFYTNTQTIDSNHYQSEDSDQSKEEILYCILSYTLIRLLMVGNTIFSTNFHTAASL